MILRHIRAVTGWWNKKQAVCSSNVKLISDADILMNIYVALGHREERCSQNQIWHWHVDNFKLTKPNWCYSKHFDTTSLEWNVSDVNGFTFAVWEKVNIFFWNLSFCGQIWLKSIFVELTWERETWDIWSSLPLPSLLSLSFSSLNFFHGSGHRAQNLNASNCCPLSLDFCC